MKPSENILTITICTYGERIKQVAQILLAERKEVCYVIAWQTEDRNPHIPANLQRADVHVVINRTKGLSANRNIALDHVNTTWAVIGDDDVAYSSEDIDNLLTLIQRHADIDIFCLRCKIKNNGYLKPYPIQEYDYAFQPKGAYVSSVELVVKKTLQLPKMDENYGIGAKYFSCGEEEIFLIDAHNRGLKIKYFPQDLCSIENNITTGSRYSTDVLVRQAKGAVLFRRYGILSAILRITKTAFNPPHKQSIIFLYQMIKGLYYAKRLSIQHHHSRT